MKFNCLIPEIRVFDLEKSKKFYTEVLGFKVEYSRSDFAMVILDECQIMLQQLTLPSRVGSWNVSEDMKYPLGRGINFQIILDDISKVYYSLKRNNVDIFIDLLVSDYKENDINNHVLEFLIQDPDGYLLRFQQDINDWKFIGDKEYSNNLYDLVIRGKKRATCYLNDDSKEIGFSILTNYDESKRCIICTNKEYVVKFRDISEEFAILEGEGDSSLRDWKRIHKEVFKNELKDEFNDDTLIKCEEFELVKEINW